MSKLLQFTFFPTKKRVRIHLSRRKLHANKTKANEFESIGAIRVIDDNILLGDIEEKLSPDEKTELHELRYSIEFAKRNFNVKAHELDRESLRVSPKMQDISNQLGRLAQKNGIEFNPHKVMLDAWLDYLKMTEEMIEQKAGLRVQLLKEYGIDDHA